MLSGILFRPGSPGTVSAVEMALEKVTHALGGVVCVGWAVAGFIIGVLEGVAGIGIDFDVHRLAEGLHGGGEVVNVLRGDSLIEGSEVAEDGGVNLLERGWVSGQRAVVDGDGAQIRIGHGKLSRVSAAHAPADGSDAVGVDALQSLQIIRSGDEVAHAAILRESAHELVCRLRIGSYFAAVKIDGEGHVALSGEIGGLLFDPVVQAPPFMDDDDGGMRAGGGGKIEKPVNGLVSAGEGNLRGLGSGEQLRGGECETAE